MHGCAEHSKGVDRDALKGRAVQSKSVATFDAATLSYAKAGPREAVPIAAPRGKA